MRRIQVAGKDVYQIRPSFMMPYQIGATQEVARGLYMLFSGASLDQVTQTFGRNDMFWWRAFTGLGRNSIVGTTLKSPEKLPEHLLADEKHTWWYDQRVYLATTIGNGCILGAELSVNASETALKNAYQTFEREACGLKPNFTPQSVNTDGWKGTRKAWKNLFEGKVILVLCFLHLALSIRDRCRRWQRKKELMDKVWDAYRAETLSIFSQRVRRLKEWTLQTQDMPDTVREKVLDFCCNATDYKRYYDCPGSHRTSNMLDRIMDWQDRTLYKMRYLHSLCLQGSGRLLVRAMALLWNFHPFCKKIKRHSPFADLNGFVYHTNWLENMMIAASLGGWSRAK